MKKMMIAKTVLLSVVCTMLCSGVSFGAKLTPKKAQKWVKKKEWAHGFEAMPHETADLMEFATQYAKNKAVWDKTFEWLATHDLFNMPAGKYEVDGDHCFINVQDAVTKTPDQVKIESHVKYIDLQYVVAGTERFGLVAAEDATVSEPLRGDNIFYKAPVEAMKYYNSNPGTFFLFFPDNYHQALLQAGKASEIRKVVAKIEYVK